MNNYSKMLRHVIPIILINLLAHYTKGQTNFRDGFIVDSAGDTTFLKIKDRLLGKRKFVTVQHQGVRQDISLGNIKFLRIAGESLYQVDSSKLYSVLLHGEISLLVYNRFFWLQKGEKKVKLKTEEVSRQINGLTKNVIVPVWRNTLASFTGSCSRLSERHKLSQTDLIEILTDYHGCASKPYKVIKRTKKKYALTFRSGIEITQSIFVVNETDLVYIPNPLLFDLDGAPFLLPDKYYSSDNYFNFSVAINLDRRNEFFIRSGFNYGSSSFSGVVSPSTENTSFLSVVRYDALSIPLQVGYQKGWDKIKLQGSIGLFFGQFLNIDTIVFQDTPQPYGRVVSLLENALIIHSNYLGYSAELGGFYYFGPFHTGISLKYSIQNGVDRKTALKADHIRQSVELFLGYTLNLSK